MQPLEFIMEMSGISKVLGPDEPPTLAQWQRIHAMLAETMGPLVARKLFELGEEYERQKATKQTELDLILKQYRKQGMPPGIIGVGTPYLGSGTQITTTTTTGPQPTQPVWLSSQNIK